MSGSFVQELKRRNVFRVTVVYIVASWLLMQIGDVMFPALRLPEWTTTMLVAFLILGLPISIIFAWAYEVTPDGIKRTEDVDPDKSITRDTGQKINYVIITVLLVAVVLLVGKISFDTDTTPTESGDTPEKSIAVLPFDNRSADEENAEFFAAGVHDELLTLLSKLGDLKVISPEEDHLWATTYDRELTASNIFDVQSDIARTIADELHVQLSVSDNTLLNVVPTNNMEALQRYMLGRQLIERGTFESFEQATRYLSEATELDRNYAEAWVAIAYANNRMYQTGLIGLQEYIAAAVASIERAIEINDALPEAHAELAALRWQSGDVDAAEASFKTALALGSGDSQSLYAYGNYLRTTGRPQEAIPVLKRALEGNPLSVDTLFELGKAEMYSGQPEQTIIRAEKMLEIDPSSVHGYVAKLQAYHWMGRFDLMWPWYIKSMASDPEDFELWAHLGLYSHVVGATELVERYLDHARQLGPQEPSVLRCYVTVLEQRGQFDAAVGIARSALKAGLDDRWQSNEIFLRLIRDDALRTGNLDEARSWYLDRHPELFLDAPIISVGNINAAADLALLLQHAGEPAAADVLIGAGLAWVQRTQPAGVHGYLINIADVELLALSGQKQAALDTLQQAVDGGWKSHWRSVFSNETLASLRNEPRFQRFAAQLESDMATQLAAIRALPDMGEFDLR